MSEMQENEDMKVTKKMQKHAIAIMLIMAIVMAGTLMADIFQTDPTFVIKIIIAGPILLLTDRYWNPFKKQNRN